MSLERKKLYVRAMWGLDRQFPSKGYAIPIVGFVEGHHIQRPTERSGIQLSP